MARIFIHTIFGRDSEESPEVLRTFGKYLLSEEKERRLAPPEKRKAIAHSMAAYDTLNPLLCIATTTSEGSPEAIKILWHADFDSPREFFEEIWRHLREELSFPHATLCGWDWSRALARLVNDGRRLGVEVPPSFGHEPNMAWPSMPVGDLSRAYRCGASLHCRALPPLSYLAYTWLGWSGEEQLPLEEDVRELAESGDREATVRAAQVTVYALRMLAVRLQV